MSVLYIDAFGCGLLGKSGHGHHRTGDGNEESCTGTHIGFSDIYGKALGTAKLLRIVGK